jgi:RNA polymerase sigma-70 factor, ECF subfamily
MQTKEVPNVRGCNSNHVEFWSLWLKYEKNLKIRCLRWTGSIAFAEDIIGTTMMRAYDQASKQTQVIKNFHGWILRIAYHVFIDMLRKQKRQIIMVDDFESFISINTSVPLNGTESAEEIYLKNEFRYEIINEIKSLPSSLRAIAVLRLLFELPYEDISIRMNLKNANVRKRFQKARALLQKQINYYDGF